MVDKHLIFYDGQCGLCDRAVQFVLKRDKKKLFLFAPLQGRTAEELLKELPGVMKSADSLVLIENYQSKARLYFVLGKGALRICWLMGGVWALIGLVGWLPGFFYNWIYRLIAKNRHLLFTYDCLLKTPENAGRFLP